MQVIYESMNQKDFKSFISQLQNHVPAKIGMHMKHCCTPKPQDSYVFHDLLGRTLYWDCINTGKHKF